MTALNQHEADPRFPSGPWTGFFLMPQTGSQRHGMSITLEFISGKMTGTGTDFVGRFLFTGSYDLTDGKCTWMKQYVGRHDVLYSGYNEGKGIWGVWEIPDPRGMPAKGGFHIWPEGMGDPTKPELEESVDLPVVVDVDLLEPVGF